MLYIDKIYRFFFIIISLETDGTNIYYYYVFSQNLFIIFHFVATSSDAEAHSWLCIPWSILPVLRELYVVLGTKPRLAAYNID